MADAIWNDRFILSNMTSEKLYAKSPLTTGVSGTSAYIGLEPSATYNETVLWSGSNNSTFTLNSPASAYEYIDVHYHINYQDKICCKRFSGNSLRIGIFDAENGDRGIWMRCNEFLSNNYLTYNVTQPGPWVCGITTTGMEVQSANQISILEVRGINRKEV